MSNPNDPAYPNSDTCYGGLTTRQEFIKAAMQGLLANRDCCTAAYVLAGLAREFADATLAEEARTRGEK